MTDVKYDMINCWPTSKTYDRDSPTFQPFVHNDTNVVYTESTNACQR